MTFGITRRRLLAAGVGVLVLALTFSAGRFSTPVRTTDKIQYKDRVVYKERDLTEYADSLKIGVAAHTKTVIRYIKTPDGTVTHEETRESGSESKTQKDVDLKRVTSAEVEAVTTVVQERIVDRVVKPRLHVQVLGGLDLSWRRHWGAGASVSGPAGTTIGGWVLPSGKMAGVSVGLTF